MGAARKLNILIEHQFFLMIQIEFSLMIQILDVRLYVFCGFELIIKKHKYVIIGFN